MASKIPFMDFDLYPPFEGFPKECIRFIKQLKRNNNREWFEKHREEFEQNAKIPMLSFIAALQPHFARFAPEFDLNPKRSIFRVYRDIRFSSDKTPYKTHIAAHFVLRGRPKGFIGSGYYIQIEPGEFFVGGGIYLPDGDQLKKIRNAIATHGEEFLSIVENRRFKKRFAPYDWSKLQRVPKGYNANHPMADWLMFKQFFVGVSLPESKCYHESLLDETAQICEEAAPLVRFLNRGLM
jgi:uncharacterized protein (TIGR02453 family)